jgi:hypothetical protein
MAAIPSLPKNPQIGDPRLVSDLNANDTALMTAVNNVDITQAGGLILPDANLTSPNNAVWKTLMSGSGYIGGFATGTYYLNETTGIITGTPTTVQPPMVWQNTIADQAVAGKTTYLRMRLTVMVGATSPSTVTLSLALAGLTIAAGNYTVNVVGWGPAASAGLATNTVTTFVGGVISPVTITAGAFVPRLVVGSIAVPAGIAVSWEIQYNHQ